MRFQLPPCARLLVLLSLALAGCECGAPQAEGPAMVVLPGAYFPAAAGDRWRYRSNLGDGTRSVTDLSEGTATLIGADRVLPLRIRVRDDAVVEVNQEGREMARLLDAPIELDHRWNYESDGVRCEAHYSDVNASFDVAGLHLEGCISVSRTCLYPEGQPFSAPTRQTRQETYCPNLGRVRESVRFDPSPPNLEAGRDDELVFYRVAGAPRPATRPQGCDGFLLTLADVRAACGPQFRHHAGDKDDAGEGAEEAAPNECSLRFSTGEHWIEIRQSTQDAEAANGERVLHVAENGRSARIEMSEGACASDRFPLLAPLVQSLLRD